MEALKVALIVLFAIISVLLILLVLIQNDEGGGLGGLLSGAGSAAFGSHSATVINKTTFVLVALFFVTAFAIARLNKAPAVKDITSEPAVEQTATPDAEASEWWNEDLTEKAVVPEDTMAAPEVQE